MWWITFLSTTVALAQAETIEVFQPIFSEKNPKIGKQLTPANPSEFEEILYQLASKLVGKPYQLGALGEGPGSEHPEPLYRLDVFDCTTFLETVMANALCYGAGSKAGHCLARRMLEIRYSGKKVQFRARNHIPELDWLPHNTKRGLLRDLSQGLFEGEWRTAEVTIDRDLWLASRNASELKAKDVSRKSPLPGSRISYLPISFFFEKYPLSSEEREKIEADLAAKDEEIRAKKKDVKLSSSERDQLVKEKFRAELAYLRAAYKPLYERLIKIPSGTVLNLIRAEEKDLKKAKITPLVAHQGLIIQRAQGARFLHAAANSGHVQEQDLGDYLLRYLRSANFRGISLYQILPKK